MGTISVSLPSDGDTIDAADYNTPINAIVDEVNGGLDNSNIATGAAISGSKIADGTITPANLTSGTGTSWGLSSWSPTLTNITVGSGGTTSYTYIQTGKMVFFKIIITFGTGPSISSGSISLPVTASGTGLSAGDSTLGSGTFRDTSASDLYIAYPLYGSTTTLAVRFQQGTTKFSGAAPVTVASGDIISLTGSYEAA